MNFDNEDYYNGEKKMNRKDWDFEYTTKVLADAAAIKRDYRHSRVEWWQEQYDKLMLEVKDCGLEVSESVANSYSTSAGRGPKVMVRTDLQDKLSEAHERIRKHQEAEREYDGWVQVLDAQSPHDKLKLKHADWLFFFGRD